MNEQLFLAVNAGWARPWLDPVMRAATLWANPVMLFLTTAVLLWFWDKPRWRENLARLLLAVAVAVVASESLKFVFNTPRPLMSLGAARVRVLGTPEYARGFPSGHTARAFGAASAFVADYPALGALLLLASVVVGLSRLYVGAHFPADVAGGLAVGVASGLAVARWLKRR